MPRLARIRFVSIGHPSARMEDFTLDLRDGSGRPTDSVLWLRNGGGKSSILNLFFSVVRPGRREFLGAKAEARKRRLEDYILADDRSVVACEWELDDRGGRLDFSDAPETYLTGAFCERRAGTAEEDRLRRLFFAARGTAGDARMRLEDLPLFVASQDGMRGRRTLAGFRAEWMALRDRYPQLEMSATDNLREWAEILENAGIDPELFGYQVRMNQREGAVDELFRFDEHEKFVDFLLELALDPAQSERVRRNVEAYRRELTVRKHELVPERELAEGLAFRLTPLVENAAQRSELTGRVSAAAAQLERLQAELESRIESLEAEERGLREEHDRCARTSEAAREQAAGEQRRAAAFRRCAAELRYAKESAELERDSRARAEASRQSQLWEAAAPLHAALRHQQRADEIQEQLRRRQTEFAPLLSELEAAGGAFAAALRGRATGLDRQESECISEERGARLAASECRRLESDAHGREVRAESEVHRLKEWVREALQQRQELVARGALVDTERALEAVPRLEREITALHERATTLSGRAAELAASRADAAAEKETAFGEARAAAEHAAAELRRMDEALAARRALEDTSLLRALLEVETINLERLPERTAVLLRDAAHAAAERVVELRMERAEDERAAAYLADTGLLPPSRDVQQVLEVLQTRLRAWAGWEYLAANTREDEQERRRMIESRPSVAAGIVVPDADFPKACELLDELRPAPELPVTVAPIAALVNGDAAAGKVVGPASRAFYDRSEGASERARRLLRLETGEKEIHRQEDLRRQVETLVHRLEDFRDRYPRGWFDAQEATIAREQQAAASWNRRVQHLAGEISRLAEEIRTLESQRQACADAAAVKRADLERVGRYQRSYESIFEARQRELEAACDESAAAAKERTEARNRAGQLDEAAAGFSAAARMAAVEAGRIRVELDSIRYGSAQPAADTALSIDVLRDRYTRLAAEYENKVGVHELVRLREAALDQANQERHRFARALQPGIDEGAVRAVLDPAMDADAVDARRREAQTVLLSAQGKLGNQSQAVQKAQAELEKANQACRALLDVPAVQATSAVEADTQAALAENNQRRAESEASQYSDSAEKADRRAEQCAARARGLRKDVERLVSAQENSRDLIEAAPRMEDLLWAAPQRDEDCATLLSNLEASFRRLRMETRSLNEERLRHSGAVRIWAQRFELSRSPIAARFAAESDANLEANAAAWRSELGLRVQAIDGQLQGINEHRDLLIDEALGAAEDALSLMQSAQKHSKLPDHVPGLGGAQFLRITHQTPEERGERRGRIGALIDELIDSGEIPPGLSLVQQAVRRLGKPIRVRVLHPDPDVNRQAVEIVDLARFSGGEQLTAAILLYCSLAQLRARSRGLGRRSSSVLILDNPIGRASRVRFMELQREVARAMGVQLFYTTGVKDLEALRTLPNIVRVKNARRDRNTGFHVLEHEPATELDSVRIVRSDT